MNRKQKLDLARQLLEASGNDLTWVAAQLGVHPTTLYRWRKMNKL
jgi:transposase-like protein